MKAPYSHSASKKPLQRFLPVLMLPLILGLSPASLAGEFRVTRVHDGQTLRVEGCGIEIVVRLAGIEAPEPAGNKEQTNAQLALEAKSCLAEMTLNKVVEVEGHGMDEMNRVLGVLLINEVNVNLEMIKAGCARVYRGDPAHPLYLLPYVKAEENAKRARRGMWSSERDILDSRLINQAP